MLYPLTVGKLRPEGSGVTHEVILYIYKVPTACRAVAYKCLHVIPGRVQGKRSVRHWQQFVLVYMLGTI